MNLTGPDDPLRSAAPGDLATQASKAALAAGVTRLAEITHLDCLGLPVWQAVRPMSRALSVHMGKGASDAEARIGALMEALESHHAEQFDVEGPRCSFGALPPGARPSRIDDLAADRNAPPDPDESCRWVAATNLATGHPFFLPFDLVSLDLTRAWDSRFDRSSNGLAAGTSHDEAVRVALHEAIERDAMIEWRSGGILACMASALDPDGMDFDWFRDWRACFEANRIAARFYHVPSVTGSPVIACELTDLDKAGAPYSAVQGAGCHPFPEVALFKAMAEAIQCRATAVAGAREDLPPSAYRPMRGTFPLAFGLPRPPGMSGVDWGSIAPGPAGLGDIVTSLARAGFPQTAALSVASLDGIEVVKVHVPGLGGILRRRRTS